MSLLKQGAKDGTFLFCIPIQVGPATPYARNIRHWMHAILVVQAVMCVIRFFWLSDFLGAFWMAALCGLGWYSWYQEMNITYICIWGLACCVNGVFDTLGLILPLLFDMLSLQFIEIILRSTVPISEILGAAFAWHLYVDYYRNGGGANSESPLSGWIGQMPDPMGQMVDEVDPSEMTSLMAGIKKQEKVLAQNLDAKAIHKGLAQGGQALSEGIAAASVGLQAAGQQHWATGFDGKPVDPNRFKTMAGDASSQAASGAQNFWGSLTASGKSGAGAGGAGKMQRQAPCC